MSRHYLDKRGIYALLDGELPPKRKQKLMNHLDQCAICRTCFKQIKILKDAMGRLEKPQPDWTRMDRRMTRIIAEVTATRSRSFSSKRALAVSAITLLLITSGVMAYSLLKTYLGAPSPQSLSPPPQETSTLHGKFSLPSFEFSTLSEDGETSQFDLRPPTEEDISGETDPQLLTLDPFGKLHGGNTTSSAPKERTIRKWTGHLPRRIIKETLQDANHGIRQCYERALKRAPRLTATFQIVITVDPQGLVSSATIKDPDLSPSLVQCIEQQLMGIAFPPPEGGTMRLVMPMRLYPSS